jgi:hypothetical protein
MIIWILLFSLVLLGVFSWLATRFNWFHSAENRPNEPIVPEVCCGQHEVCLQDSLQITDTTPVYYDDEELDVFRGRVATSYTDDEIDLFENVFETLSTDDVAGWLRSIQLRNLVLPPRILEEALFIVSERRQSAQ